MGQFGDIPENVFLVTPDAVGLYPNISYKPGLKALKNLSGKKEQKYVPTETLIDLVEFMFKNNFFENNKFPERPLVQSMIPLTPVYLWIRQRLNS